MSHRQRLVSEHLPWIGLGAVGLVVGASVPAQALTAVAFAARSLLEMAPVVVIAAAIAAGLRATGLDGSLGRAFAGRGAGAILIAAGIGAITPICGVGMLPIIAGLLGAGVPLAPVMAFWLSSPITDPAMLTVTAGTLGPGFAAGKTTLAALIGIAGGTATAALVRAGAFPAPLRSRALASGDAGCAVRPVRLRFWGEPDRVALFRRDAATAAWLMVKWLTIAFLVEGLMRQHLPAELVAEVAGRRNDWAIPIAVALGAPVYLDGYAALPLVRGLLDMGMAPGAAMAFLIAGGVTSLYASVAVFALVRLPVFATYLGLALVLSLASGYAWAAIVAVLGG